MPAYVALLRAVNLGAGSTIRKEDLVSMFEDAGYDDVRTYIASGNVVFSTRAKPARITAEIERRILEHLGRPGHVHIRTAAEMTSVVMLNPFASENPSRVAALFLDKAPTASALREVRGAKNEVVRLGTRELYTFYPDGMGQSKLVIPLARQGTARNMNTVARLAEMVAELD